MCLRKDVLCRIVLLQLEHFAPAEKLRMLEVHSAFRVPVPRPSQPLTKDCNQTKRGRMFVRVVKAAGWQVAERLHIASLLSSFMAHCFEGPSTGCRALAKAQGESADHGMENGSKRIKMDQKPKSGAASTQIPSNTKVSPNEHRKTNM